MDSMEVAPITYGTVWVTPNIPVCLFKTVNVGYKAANSYDWYTWTSGSLCVYLDIEYLAGNLKELKKKGFPGSLQARFDPRRLLIYGAKDISDMCFRIHGLMAEPAEWSGGGISDVG